MDKLDKSKPKRNKKYYLFILCDLILTDSFRLYFFFIFVAYRNSVLLVYSVHTSYEYIIIRQRRSTWFLYYNVVKLTYFFRLLTIQTRCCCFFSSSSPSHFGLTLLLYFWCWCKHWNIAVPRKCDRWARQERKRIRRWWLPAPLNKRKKWVYYIEKK